MTRLELSIDELVLIGFASAERHRLADEIELELGRITVNIHPSWCGGSRRSATPPPSAGRAIRRGGSVAHQVADRISAVLAAGQAS
jgi:hypothetical protein